MRSFAKCLIYTLLMVILAGMGLPRDANAAGFLKKNISADTTKINRYTRIAFTYGQKSPPKLDLMKAYIDSAEMLCHRSNIEITSYLHLARAAYFYYTQDFKNASMEANIAMKLAKSDEDHTNIVRSLIFFGKYNFKTGMYEESLNSFNEAIGLARKYKISGVLPSAYGGMATVYKSLGKIPEYRKALEDVIRYAGSENDARSLMDAYYLLGTSYTDVDRDPRKADSLLKRAASLARIKNDTVYSALSLANQGWNFYLTMQYDSAINLYNQSLRYSLKSKKYPYSANAYGNLGTIYRDMGKPDVALKFYIKSIDQAKMVEDVYDLSWVYLDLSQMYLLKRDTSNAYKTYVLHKKYSDKILQSSSSQGMTDAKIRYEAESRNKEFQLLSLRVKNQRLIIYGSSILFVLSLAVLILFLSRAKINAKRRMAEMNRKIAEITQANLRQQMNPHFIFNTLNSIQYYMYQHDKLATNDYLTKFSSLMRKVLENSQHTSVPLQDELDALKLYLELEKIRFKNKFDYQIYIEEEIDPLLYKVPTMLIQPYVENSICHGLMPSEEKGLIRIDMKLKKDYISCTIEDNGIGREAATVIKNGSANNHNSIGTRIVSSRLELVNALYGTDLKTIYTDLKNEKGEPEGTRVEIYIPLLT